MIAVLMMFSIALPSVERRRDFAYVGFLEGVYRLDPDVPIGHGHSQVTPHHFYSGRLCSGGMSPSLIKGRGVDRLDGVLGGIYSIRTTWLLPSCFHCHFA